MAFALGGVIDSFVLMQLGRFIFGIGGESLAVAQNTYAVSWFKGKELNMAWHIWSAIGLGELGSLNPMQP